MEFRYIAVNTNGEKLKGLVEANTQKEVIDYLRAKDLTPVTIGVSRNLTTSLQILQKVKASDIVLFTRQLSSMILTGLTLLEALTILKRQMTNRAMQDIVESLINEISEGSSFSQALSRHRNVFSNVYIALVRAAETAGLLDKVLARLADNLERSEELKKQIRSALFYPSIILTGVIVVLIIMNVFVIPQLGSLYESLNLDLPLQTRIILKISEMSIALFPILIILTVLGIVLYQRFSKTPTGRQVIDKVKLNFPVIGKIIHLSIVDEISRTLSLLITSGSSIIESLKVTAQVANNHYYTAAIEESRVLVEKGVPLSRALESQEIFDPVVIQMVKVGESTGKIDESLLKLSEYFERDLNLRIKTLTTSIEPIMIVILGLSVGFLIFSVITPIYGLITQIQ